VNTQPLPAESARTVMASTITSQGGSVGSLGRTKGRTQMPRVLGSLAVGSRLFTDCPTVGNARGLDADGLR